VRKELSGRGNLKITKIERHTFEWSHVIFQESTKMPSILQNYRFVLDQQVPTRG